MNNTADKKLVMLVNLGSPESLTYLGVYKFLAKFLSDKRVVGLPRILWYPLLYFVILPLRIKKVKSNYSRIVTIVDNQVVFPLIGYTISQSSKLAGLVDNQTDVCYAFSYSHKTIKSELERILRSKNYSHIKIIPLYPQYSTTTTLPIFDQVAKLYIDSKIVPKVDIVWSFYNHPKYISALANLVQQHWRKNKKGDKFVISYHSLPKKLIDDGDVYLNECNMTATLLIESLGLNPQDCIISFQSKFGRAEWVGPSTEDIIINLATSGIKNIDVICPGFFSDCLETLEEINIGYRDVFIENGGINFSYISCLNDTDDAINLLYSLIN